MISSRESLDLIVRIACMISARLSRGHHKLVSEPTACRKPLSNSLAEVESRLEKLFSKLLTVLCGLRARITYGWD